MKYQALFFSEKKKKNKNASVMFGTLSVKFVQIRSIQISSRKICSFVNIKTTSSKLS